MLKWISKIFHLSSTSVKEENNIVQSIAKAKALHRVLISKAHPDKNPSKESLNRRD